MTEEEVHNSRPSSIRSGFVKKEKSFFQLKISSTKLKPRLGNPLLKVEAEYS
jgi:hypothetical protein